MGGAAGALAAGIVSPSSQNHVLGIALGAALGTFYAATFRFKVRAYPDSAMSAAALAFPLWALFSMIVFPLVSGQPPAWGARDAAQTFPHLATWIAFTAITGVFVQAFSDAGQRFFDAEQAVLSKLPFVEPTPVRIVVLGGGFAGVATAESLERTFGPDLGVDITLVSDTNALLFTPMLAEVAGSSLEPTHISSPLRTSLRRTHVVRGTVTEVDLEGHRIILGADEKASDIDTLPASRALGYDHCVLALGSVSNYLGLENVERIALGFKSLLDAIRIRNRVIDMFERADRESNCDKRKELLTFVIAGGGFAGAELAGALNDFTRGILADYPHLDAEQLRIVLVHSRDRILPELSDELAAYARKSLVSRGVSFSLGRRVVDARPGVVILDSGKEIFARTLIWTAGAVPNPLIATLPVERDKRGAVNVENTFAVAGQAGLWALGDCAAIVDARSGARCPPTAQFAIRQASFLARNIHAAVKGKPLRPFRSASLGTLCVVGHHTACAEIALPFARKKFVHFSGLLAWCLWRAVYLSKLPGVDRKARVLFDWLIELVFPRDIVQTIELDQRA